MADASRPLTASGCLAGDPAAAELRNQACPVPPARYGPVSHARTLAV